ncbi:MAG: hypothetical protein D6818_05950, partial [Bacteroidetes bacterium]
IWLILACMLVWAGARAQGGVISGYLGKKNFIEGGIYVAPVTKVSEDGSLLHRVGGQLQVGRAVARHASARLGLSVGSASKDVLLAPGDWYPEWAMAQVGLAGASLGLEFHGDQLAPIGKYLSGELAMIKPSLTLDHFLTELEDGEETPYREEFDQAFANQPGANMVFRVRVGQRTILSKYYCWNFGLAASYVLNPGKTERSHPRLPNFNTPQYDLNAMMRQYFAVQAYVMIGLVW